MTQTQNYTHFYELLKSRVISITQFRHIYNVLSGNIPALKRYMFNDDEFKAILTALNTHGNELNKKTNTYKKYSFGNNPKFPDNVKTLPDVARQMEDEDIKLCNRKVRRQEDTITTRVIKQSYKFGALKVDTTCIDLSLLPTIEVNGRTVRVALIEQ
jgi:hypothetical protein